MRKEGLGEVRAFRNDAGILVMRMITTARPRNIYELSRPLPLRPVSVKSGRAMLVSFEAKTIAASLETGEAKLLVQLRQNDRHQDNLKRTLSLTNQWKTYYLPLESTVDIRKGNLKLALQFGYPPQEILLRNLKLELFNSEVNPEDLPSTRLTYAGRATAAGWRIEAARRIERHRKGSFSLQFVDENDHPLTDAEVLIQQTRHHFRWGAAVNAKSLAEEPRRLDILSRSFNTVVFENDLKIKAWSKPEKRAVTLAVIDSLSNRGIAVKGHTLIWPGFRYLPISVRTNADDPQRVASIMENHVNGILEATSGKISHWDVVNEAYSNRDLQKITGSEEVLYRGFRATKDRDSTAGRYLNEFGIISRGGHDETKQRWYHNYIQRVDRETGGLVQGIGIQSHMGSDLTPPERVLEILDFYADLGKEISISEFTIDLDDPELRFDYTRDFMTIAFSHPSVREFLFWGWYGKTHPKADIFSEDWTPGSMGAAYFQLVHKLWHTEVSAFTDAGGRIQGRGFYGDYTYTIKVGDKTCRGTFSLLPGQPLMRSIRIVE